MKIHSEEIFDANVSAFVIVAECFGSVSLDGFASYALSFDEPLSGNSNEHLSCNSRKL